MTSSVDGRFTAESGSDASSVADAVSVATADDPWSAKGRKSSISPALAGAGDPIPASRMCTHGAGIARGRSMRHDASKGVAAEAEAETASGVGPCVPLPMPLPLGLRLRRRNGSRKAACSGGKAACSGGKAACSGDANHSKKKKNAKLQPARGVRDVLRERKQSKSKSKSSDTGRTGRGGIHSDCAAPGSMLADPLTALHLERPECATLDADSGTSAAGS